MSGVKEPKQYLPTNRDAIIISRGIDRELYESLSDTIKTERKHDACTVFLTTRGGDAHAGYRIGRCLRHNYQHVRLVVPSLCKSAGTLIAIAADEMAIGDMGELGPLDVQVRKHNEIFENSSGLDFSEALNAALTHSVQVFRRMLIEIRGGTRVSTKLAGDFAATIASNAAASLYAQIDPQKVGAMNRAITIAVEYGNRLNDMSKSLKSEEALYNLVMGYPSHGFVIDRKEAATLFNHVCHPTDDEDAFCRALWGNFQDENGFGPFVLSREHEGDSNEHQDASVDDASPANDDAKNGADGDQPQGVQGSQDGAVDRGQTS